MAQLYPEAGRPRHRREPAVAGRLAPRGEAIETRAVPSAPLLYGHRGAPRERPENTIASFERALELGADVIETDVHVTADGHFVLSHDASGTRMTGTPTAIREATLAELSQWDAGWGYVAGDGSRPFAGSGYRIPTLEEVLVSFPGVPFNLDVKDKDLRVVAPLLSLLRRCGAEQRVRLASFHARILASVRARRYAGATSLSQAEVLLLFALPAPMFRAAPCTGSAAQIPERTQSYNLGRRSVVKRCHRAGLRVDFWTVNDPDRGAELLALGADGLITDDPASLRPIVERYRALRRP